MRNFLTSVGLFILIISLQAQQVAVSSAYSVFSKDSTYFILGDVVNVRLNPDISGKVIYKLPIGEKVRIIEDTQIPYTLNGYTANWYRVVYRHNMDKGEGYVWGGAIATQTVESKAEKGLIFLYGVSSVEENEYREKVTIVIKICKDNKEISKVETEATGGLTTFTNSENMGDKGIPGIKDVFKINFSDGYCGGAFADAFFFWDGTTIFHAITLPQWFDAPYFSENSFIFPNENNGSKKGLIINKIENGFYDDNSKKKIEEKHTHIYQWTGIRLIMIKQGK